MKRTSGRTFAKLFCSSLFIGLLFSCQTIGKKDRIASLNNSVFCIAVIYRTETGEKRAASGTGFLVGENLIASAYHVQADVEKLLNFARRGAAREVVAWKKFPSGEVVSFPIELAAFDKDSDVALYRFDKVKLSESNKTGSIAPLRLAERLPTPGEEVVSIGYYGDYEMPFNSLGNVSMIDRETNIFSDLTLMPGNSGSPLCSVETGEVLGVNVNVMAIGDGTMRLGIAKRIGKLKTLLENYKDK